METRARAPQLEGTASFVRLAPDLHSRLERLLTLMTTDIMPFALTGIILDVRDYWECIALARACLRQPLGSRAAVTKM